MKIEINKPVIPRFIADWIEKEKTYFPFHKSFAKAVDLVNRDENWRNWTNEVGSSWSRILATAWVNGYGVEQDALYYARIKGWELTEDECAFWNYRALITNITPSRLYTGDKEQEDFFVINKMTIEEWNRVGINDTNADFEVVSE